MGDIENSMLSGPQPDDLEMMPEITPEIEQLVLAEIDPNWRDEFRTASAAWNHHFAFDGPLMQRLALDFYRERAAAEFRRQILARQITDELLDEIPGIVSVDRLLIN